MELRRELGIGEHDLMLLSVGELNNNKNHRVIVRAVGELRNPHIHYYIAGTGNQIEKRKALAEELGIRDKVQFLGFRSDVADLYQAADIFCFPSLREGLGMAALEAMSSSLPLITLNVHGINDYNIDGVSGYKYKRQDVNGFANGI